MPACGHWHGWDCSHANKQTLVDDGPLTGHEDLDSCQRRREISALIVATAVYKGSYRSYLIYSEAKDKEQNSQCCSIVKHLNDIELYPVTAEMQDTEGVIWIENLALDS